MLTTILIVLASVFLGLILGAVFVVAVIVREFWP
jgi:hypothetical protein